MAKSSYRAQQEQEYKHRAARGDLGVRVQTSGISDPTVRETIDNIMIMDMLCSVHVRHSVQELPFSVLC